MKRRFLSVSLFLVALLTGSFVQKNTNKQDVIAGKKLYETSCKSCHKLFDDFTGTAMYGTLERIPNKAWLYEFVRHSAEMVRKDAYAKCLYNKFNSLMPMYTLRNNQVDAIYAYVYSEAKKRSDVWDNKKYFVSCK